MSSHAAVLDSLSPDEAKGIRQVVKMLRRSRSILFVTGAGLSGDSGLPTYCGIGGLYQNDGTEDGLPIEGRTGGRCLHGVGPPARSPVTGRGSQFCRLRGRVDHTKQPSDRDSPSRVRPGGRFEALAATVQDLIALAHGGGQMLRRSQIVGAPQWTATELFDVMAQAESNAGPAARVPPDLLLQMVRNLLADQFQLKLHSADTSR